MVLLVGDDGEFEENCDDDDLVLSNSRDGGLGIHFSADKVYLNGKLHRTLRS